VDSPAAVREVGSEPAVADSFFRAILRMSCFGGIFNSAAKRAVENTVNNAPADVPVTRGENGPQHPDQAGETDLPVQQTTSPVVEQQVTVKSSIPAGPHKPETEDPFRFDHMQADKVLADKTGKWGRCEWRDTSANSDRNCFLLIRNRLCSIPDEPMWDPFIKEKGLVRKQLDLMLFFVSEGAEGIHPALSVAHVVCDSTLYMCVT